MAILTMVLEMPTCVCCVDEERGVMRYALRYEWTSGDAYTALPLSIVGLITVVGVLLINCEDQRYGGM